MPDVTTSRGHMITVDDEDLDLADGFGWRLWRRKERQQSFLVRDMQARKRRYRLLLHREVAFRMRPDLVKKADLVKVTCLNGNYCDVRRDNIEITVRPRPRGHVRRPRGHKISKSTGTPKGTAPAWSKDGCRGATGGGDGSAGAPPDPASEFG